MTQRNVLLYSKYSNYSKKFIDLYKNSKLDIHISLVCIDNEKIRKRIVKSKDIDIQNVPCLLIIYENGKVDKFEGKDSFIWINDIIIQTQQFEQQRLQEQLELQKKQEYEMQQKLLMKQQQEKEEQERQKVKKVNKNKKKITTIIEENDDNMPDSIMSEEPNQAPIIFDDEFGIADDEQIHDVINDEKKRNEDIIKKKRESVRKNDLVSVAQQMQKLREAEEKKINSNHPVFSKFKDT